VLAQGRTSGRFAQSMPEDLWFFHKAQQAGFRIYCDRGIKMGQITPVALWPTHYSGEWRIGVQFNGYTGMTVIGQNHRKKG
jgi:hypothetical protein